MYATYKYRLFTNHIQDEALEGQLSEACLLYNAALQERRDAYTKRGVSINYYAQANQLKVIRQAGDCRLANFSACQDVLRRVDKTFAAFFRRTKAGLKGGYPRFKSRQRFDSYTFPSYGDGCRLAGNRLYLQGVGHIKVKLHRPVDGVIKTITIKRECGKWFACFNVEVQTTPLPDSANSTGIDLGLMAFATLADGTEIPNPRYAQRAQARVRVAQRRIARRKRGSKHYREAVLLFQKAHAKIKRQRADFHHKTARKLVNTYGIIAIERLNVTALARSMLAKPINDAAWGGFLDILAQKAAEAGRTLIAVDPSGTSQTCLCGAPVPKLLRQRVHQCSSCGLVAARDHVSAQLILRQGLCLLAST
jgi:putative transposase